MARFEITDFQRIAGYSVVETPALPFNGLLVDTKNRVLLCGELAHLAYMVRMSELNARLREEVQANIDAYAKWVRG